MFLHLYLPSWGKINTNLPGLCEWVKDKWLILCLKHRPLELFILTLWLYFPILPIHHRIRYLQVGQESWWPSDHSYLYLDLGPALCIQSEMMSYQIDKIELLICIWIFLESHNPTYHNSTLHSPWVSQPNHHSIDSFILTFCNLICRSPVLLYLEVGIFPPNWITLHLDTANITFVHIPSSFHLNQFWIQFHFHIQSLCSQQKWSKKSKHKMPGII